MKQLPHEIKLTYIIAIILMMIFVAFIIFIVFLYNKRQIFFHQEQQLKEAEHKNQLLQKEISIAKRMVELKQSALSAQMNPHFIFNSLSAIQYFVNSQEKEKSSEYLGQLSRLVRMFLNQASEPFISLEEEVKRLRLYVNLEQLRFGNFECYFYLADIAQPDLVKIPNMLLQPFIENAILHGVSHLPEKDGQININFFLQSQLLTIEIIDNGYGIDPKRIKESSHISKGLAIIRERLEMMQENQPKARFSVVEAALYPTEKRKGHQVIITLTIA